MNDPFAPCLVLSYEFKRGSAKAAQRIGPMPRSQAEVVRNGLLQAGRCTINHDHAFPFRKCNNGAMVAIEEV